MEPRRPTHIIDTVNQVTRASRQMFLEFGRVPVSEELAEKLPMPVANVRRLPDIARTPIRLDPPPL